MSLLDVENLTSGYGRNNIIRGVTLSAEHGSITAIIGPNGAGKTTLVQTIAGVVDARGGSVTLDGQNLEGMSARERARRGLGYTPQLRNVFGALSVEDNLEVVTRAMGLPRERLDEAFDLFPILAERRKQRAGTLSGGQRQQLAIASSLLMRPQLLILDEPTTGLAPRLSILSSTRSVASSAGELVSSGLSRSIRARFCPCARECS